MTAETGKTAEASKAPAAPPVTPLDPRRTPFRADLAAQSLYGRVAAPRYVPGERRQVTRAAVALRAKPLFSAGFTTEALYGEMATVYDEGEGWAWLQLERDGYVGYAPSEALSAEVHEATHKVKALGTFVYTRPDMKSPPTMHLSLGSLVAVAEQEGEFYRLANGGYVFSRHVVEKGWIARDYAEIAERLIGTPYLWGGRTRIGIDCSGLVQAALEAAGIACPRDSDMQEAELGAPVPIRTGLDNLRRGDLVFWKGHVGIMIDGVMMVHANAHHMAVVAETLPEAAGRIRRLGGEIISIKRLPALCGKPAAGAGPIGTA